MNNLTYKLNAGNLDFFIIFRGTEIVALSLSHQQYTHNLDLVKLTKVSTILLRYLYLKRLFKFSRNANSGD